MHPERGIVAQFYKKQKIKWPTLKLFEHLLLVGNKERGKLSYDYPVVRGSCMPRCEWNGDVELSLEHRKHLMDIIHETLTLLQFFIL